MSKVKVTIAAVDGSQKKTQVSTSLTGYQVKQHIYENVTQSLGTHQMHLTYAGVPIKNDKTLSYYKIAERGGELKIIQSKLPLSEVASIILAYETDPISQEQQTARMPCGHVIGRDCMTMYVRNLLCEKFYEIKCPSQKPNGEDCEMQWEYKLCRTIGGFTAQECAQFEEGLSKNWVKKFTVQCPSCHMDLIKESQSAQIVCPSCKYGPFCPMCLKKWINKGKDFCGNMDCKMINNFLQNSPWIIKKKLGGIEYKLPQHRACVTCKMLIEHSSGCKHMKCTACKSEFCWACLQTPKNGKYPCGSFNDYCGSIAPTQTLT